MTSINCSVSLFPCYPVSTLCVQIVVLSEKKECMSNEHAQSDSWIAIDQASIDV